MADDITHDPVTLRLRFAGILQSLAKQTGDPQIARAAGVLRGQPAGRKRKDYGADLAEVTALLESGRAKSRHQACQMVAKSKATYQSVESYTQMLMREVRKRSNS